MIAEKLRIYGAADEHQLRVRAFDTSQAAPILVVQDAFANPERRPR